MASQTDIKAPFDTTKPWVTAVMPLKVGTDSSASYQAAGDTLMHQAGKND